MKAEANEPNEMWNFPHCLGAIDGKRVEITKPSVTGSYFLITKRICLLY